MLQKVQVVEYHASLLSTAAFQKENWGCIWLMMHDSENAIKMKICYKLRQSKYGGKKVFFWYFVANP